MGAAVRVTGRLVSSPSAGQSREIVVDQKSNGDVVVLGDCDTEVLVFLSQE
jgi:asparaginyl-tRNA synthetase